MNDVHFLLFGTTYVIYPLCNMCYIIYTYICIHTFILLHAIFPCYFFFVDINTMWLKNTWITIMAILVISSNIACQNESQSIIENKIVQNNSIVVNKNNKNNSRKLIGDIISNIMKDFVPHSDIDKHCTKDGQTFIDDLNNQTLWAVRSELL